MVTLTVLTFCCPPSSTRRIYIPPLSWGQAKMPWVNTPGSREQLTTNMGGGQIFFIPWMEQLWGMFRFPKSHQQDWAPVFRNGNLSDKPLLFGFFPFPVLFSTPYQCLLGSPLNLHVSVFWGNPNKILTFIEKLLYEHTKGFIVWLFSHLRAHAFAVSFADLSSARLLDVGTPWDSSWHTSSFPLPFSA